MKLKVAGIQMAYGGDRDSNLEQAVALANMAAGGGAGVICYHALFNTPWFPAAEDPAGFSLAEGEDGPTLTRMRREAQRLRVSFVLPLFEKDGEAYYCTAYVIGPGGETKGRYRKVHIPDIPFWRERYYFTPGEGDYPVFEHGGLPFGVQICWDNFFPEGARILALKGAAIVFAPTAAAFFSHHKWETVMTASAIVNGLYLMRVNRIGQEAGLDFYGRSFCADPEGDFAIGPVGIHEGVILAEVDTERVGQVRREWNFMGGRRPETYGDLARGIPEGAVPPPGGGGPQAVK